jgi:hypothetical protein
MTEQQKESGSPGVIGRARRSSQRPGTDDAPSEREVTIYGIRIRGDDRYVYVGATTQTLRRRRATGYPSETIAAVLSGVEWEMFPLESCALGQQVEREAHWIETLTREGHPLANAAAPSPLNALPVAPSISGTTWGDAEYAKAGYGRLGLRLPAGDLKKLESLAKQAGITRSALLAQWIEQAWSKRK